LDNRILYSAILIAVALVISAVLTFRRGWWERALASIGYVLRHSTTRELLVLALLWGVFVATYLYPTLTPERSALDSTWSGGGIEYERLAGNIIPIEVGLTRYQHIPTWNPYMASGIPTLGDAFNYLFNPFFSLPPLILGAIQGVKISMAIALLIAAWGAWALAKSMGIGTVGRIMVGVLYMASGGIAGKFNPGHVQLAVSLCWAPLVLAGMWWTLRTKSHFAPVLMAVTFALMFYSGNIYYTLHTLVCAAVMTLLHIADRVDGRWKLRLDRVRRVLIGGAFAFGLSALQFMPVWTVRDSVDHFQNPELAGRYSIEVATLNFIYPYPAWSVFERPDVANPILLVGVDYSYIGLVPFLLMGMGTAALLSEKARKHISTRAGGAAFILAIVMLVWGAGQSSILQWLYTHVELLAEFRYVGRAHAIAGLWFIILAGFSVDALWQMLSVDERFATYSRTRLIRILTVGVILWALYVVYSAQNDETRLAIARNNYTFFYAIDYIHFMSMRDATDALWFVVLAFPLFDTALIAVTHFFRRAWGQRKGLSPRLYGVRLGQIALMFLACVGFADLMNANGGLYWYTRRFADYLSLYQHIRAVDPNNPFPDLNEPETQMTMFQSYYNEVRNRGLNEGWTPVRVPGTFVMGEGLGTNDLARWIISFTVNTPNVQDYNYELQQCARTDGGEPIRPNPVTDCNFYGDITGALYVRPQALPYAFIAPAYMLPERADELTPQNVDIPLSIEHEQDTITMRAVMPPLLDATLLLPDLPDYYLIVQETNFPGWQVFMDDVPVPTISIHHYIGIPMEAGEHSYTLRYQPPGLASGVVIFIVTLVCVGFYLHANKQRQILEPAQ
jgi:hypothetical protein